MLVRNKLIKELNKSDAVGTKTNKGELNALQEKIKSIEKQTEAYKILRSAKINDKIATELSNDAEIAALVIANNKSKKLKELIKLVKQYQKALKSQTAAALEGRSAEEKLTSGISLDLAKANLSEALIDLQYAKEIKDQNNALEKQEKILQGINDEIDNINEKEIDPLQDRIANNNFILQGIAIVEDEINKQYDEQIKALDKVATLNQEINNIQKQRMSIADALTRGDISAAAQAAQEARAQQAQSMIATQKTSLTAIKESALNH